MPGPNRIADAAPVAARGEMSDMTTGPSSESPPSGARGSAGGAAAAAPPLAPGPARMVVLVGAVLALLTYLCAFFGASVLLFPITLVVGGGVLGLMALLPGVGRVLPAATAISVTGFLMLLLGITSSTSAAVGGAVGWVALAFGLLSAAALVGALLLDIGLVAMPAPKPAREQAAGPQGPWNQPGYGPAPGQPGYAPNPGGYGPQPGYGEGYPGQPGAFGQPPGYAPQGYGPQPGHGGYAPQGYGPGYGGGPGGPGAYGASGYGAAQPGQPYPGAGSYPVAPGQGQEPAGGSLFAASGPGAPQPAYGAAPTGAPDPQQPAAQHPARPGSSGQGGSSWAGPEATAAVPPTGQASGEKGPETLVEGADDDRTHSLRQDGDPKGSTG